MFSVNVAPDMSMYNLLKSQGYDPAYALAEFIDNALQAYISSIDAENNLDSLKISLYFYSHDFGNESLRNSIVIQDNGPGITKQKLTNAMKPAKPSINKGLSEFGIGMKASAVWFTNEWKLTTKPVEENLKYIVNFNLDHLISESTEIIRVEEIEDLGSNGTTVSLNKLRKPINKEKFLSICKDLKELYQKFTSGTHPSLVLDAYFDESEYQSLIFTKKYQILNKAVFKKTKGAVYAIGKPKEWKVDISMAFEGANITGFICLWDPGSYPDNPGLVMLRYGRVIQGLSSKKFMPKQIYTTQNKHEALRVYGELIADDLPVAYTKDSFEVDQDSFASKLKELPGVKELLKQSSQYRTDNFKSVDSEADIVKVNLPVPPEGMSGENLTETPTGSLVENPTENTTDSLADNPTEDATDSLADNPTEDATDSLADNPTEDATDSLADNPTEDATDSLADNPTEDATDSLADNPTEDATDSLADNPTEDATNNGLVQLDGIDRKRQLIIQPTMLQNDFETDLYCQDLIKQINWVFDNRKTFKEIVIVALRNLLENHLDFTYAQAFPQGSDTKFDEKLNRMLELVRSSPKKNVTDFTNRINKLLDRTSQGYQTQLNLGFSYFSQESITPLLAILHLSAHKGGKLVDLNGFVSTYGKQYNMLLEFLFCVAAYNKTISAEKTQAVSS